MSPSKRIISPPRSELSKLRQPPTRGEMKVLDFFDRYLPPKWEIYFQPHLNGLKPDFVLLNPDIGIGVFEVKDWNLDAMSYSEQNGKLHANKDGKTFCPEKDNPISKLRIYKDELFHIYCPRLGLNLKNTKDAWATITIGAIFPFAPHKKAYDLFSTFLDDNQKRENARKYNPISGMEALESGNIELVFPEATRKYSTIVKPEIVMDLRGWLVEGECTREQREKPGLDPNQSKLAYCASAFEHRKIKGCAGSGKTQIIAARAAFLASQGKKVLICTYNITLINYINDLITQFRDSRVFEPPVILNFHHLCGRVCGMNGHEKEWNQLFAELNELKEKKKKLEAYPQTQDTMNQIIELKKKIKLLGKEIFNFSIPSLVNKVIDEKEKVEKYDALFVDEGQDFTPLWWRTLTRLVNEKGEKTFVTDQDQDIYGNNRQWTDEALTGTGLSGPWNVLDKSYRLPARIILLAKYFSRHFLDSAILMNKTMEQEADQKELLKTCSVNWIKCAPEDVMDCLIESLENMMEKCGPETKKAVSDITLLCDNIMFGRMVINAMAKKDKVKFIHTYAADSQTQRLQKMYFYKGRETMKATTIHSFKGWESSLIVLFVPDLSTHESKRLFYTAITRLKRTNEGSFLTIVSPDTSHEVEKLADYVNTNLS